MTPHGDPLGNDLAPGVKEAREELRPVLAVIASTSSARAIETFPAEVKGNRLSAWIPSCAKSCTLPTGSPTRA